MNDYMKEKLYQIRALKKCLQYEQSNDWDKLDPGQQSFCEGVTRMGAKLLSKESSKDSDLLNDSYAEEEEIFSFCLHAIVNNAMEKNGVKPIWGRKAKSKKNFH